MGLFILFIFLTYVLIVPLIIRFIINSYFQKDDKAVAWFISTVLFGGFLTLFINFLLIWKIVTLNI